MRKGLRIQVNEGKIYECATLFLGEEFLRLTEEESDGTTINTYYDWSRVESVRTCSAKE